MLSKNKNKPPGFILARQNEWIPSINFTCYNHHAYGEDLLIVGFGGDVTESHRGHAGHGVIKGRHVHSLTTWPVPQLDLGDRPIVILKHHDLRVRLLTHVGKGVQPAKLETVDEVRVAYWVPAKDGKTLKSSVPEQRQYYYMHCQQSEKMLRAFLSTLVCQRL